MSHPSYFVRDSQLLVINSQDRLAIGGSTSSNFYFDTRNQLDRNWRHVCVEFARIPNSVYNVGSGQNTLTWTDQAAATHNSTIPIGFYTASSLATAIALALNTDATGTNTYTCTYSDLTGKFTIAGDTANFELDFLTSTFQEITGFENLDYTGAQSYTAPNIADLFPNKTLNIVTSFPLKNAALYSSGLALSGCVASLPFDSSSLAYLYGLNNHQNAVHLISGNLPNRVLVRVVDDEGAALSLNGMEWILALRFF